MIYQDRNNNEFMLIHRTSAGAAAVEPLRGAVDLAVRFSSTVSTCRKPIARIRDAWDPTFERDRMVTIEVLWVLNLAVA
jgi:hypothetical protein